MHNQIVKGSVKLEDTFGRTCSPRQEPDTGRHLSKGRSRHVYRFSPDIHDSCHCPASLYLPLGPSDTRDLANRQDTGPEEGVPVSPERNSLQVSQWTSEELRSLRRTPPQTQDPTPGTEPSDPTLEFLPPLATGDSRSAHRPNPSCTVTPSSTGSVDSTSEERHVSSTCSTTVGGVSVATPVCSVCV